MENVVALVWYFIFVKNLNVLQGIGLGGGVVALQQLYLNVAVIFARTSQLSRYQLSKGKTPTVK